MQHTVILKHLSEITGSPLRVFTLSPDGLWKESICYAKSAAPALSPPLAEWLREDISVPSLAAVDGTRYYAIIPLGSVRYLLGPVRLASALSVRRQFAVEGETQEDTVFLCDTAVFLQAVLLPWNLHTKKEMLLQELIASNCSDRSNIDVQKYYARLTYENRETGSHHNAYSQELRLLGSIERGDIKLLEQCRDEGSSGKLGTLSPNAERSYRNVSIAAVVLASRAAIRGGMNPEAAFSLCDAYIMKIEALRDIRELQGLVGGAQNNFASLVRFLRQDSGSARQVQRHPLVEKAKNYVYDHLHEKISLTNVAKLLHTNPNYISNLFVRCEGISFTDFVLREKMALARSLLVYSQLSCREIASTLGFSSQSHFGRHFKRFSSMTPAQFQRQYAITELPETSPEA